MTDTPPPHQYIPFHFCRRCSRNLTNLRSIKHGYGPSCYGKRMTGDTRTARQMDPCTITNTDLAHSVYRAIYQLVQGLDETQQARGKCHICGTTIKEMPVESCDHDGGYVLPGFGKPQWIVLHDEHYDYAIWKLRITQDDIINEMERNGDINLNTRENSP